MAHYLLKKLNSQFLPLKEELKIGFWGEKYYLQDKDSLREMYSYLNKNNINIPLEIVPKEMVRTKINHDINFSKLKIARDITIFTHASYWDLIACILSILNEKNRKLFLRNSSLKNKIIFIRLHPALSQKKLLKKLN